MMTRWRFLGGLAAGGAAALERPSAVGGAEPGSDLRRIRLAQSSAICFAPIFVAGDGLLQAEGFAEVEYVTKRDKEGRPLPAQEALAGGDADIGATDVVSVLAGLDRGQPLVVLSGLHSGCYELFGGAGVRAIRDLKGRRVAIPGLHGSRNPWWTRTTSE